MSVMEGKRFWIIIVAVLVILNITTMAFLWAGRTPGGLRPPFRHRNGNGPEGYMVRHLGLDEHQAVLFKEARQRHFERTKPIERKLQHARHKLFRKNVDGVSVDSISEELNEIALFHKELDSLTYIHFRELRSYCTPEQSEKLDHVLQDITSPQQLRPGRGPDGPPME